MDPDSSSPLGGLASALWPLAAGATSVAVQVGILALLLALSAFFSGSRAALFALTDGDQERLRHDGDASARRVLALLARPHRLRIALLLLTNATNVAAAILAAVLTAQSAAAFGWSAPALLAAAVVVLALLLFVLDEVAPRLVATQQPARMARSVSGPLLVLVRLLSPVTRLLARVLERARPDAARETGRPHAERDDMRDDEEHALHQSLAELGGTTVREVLVSRVDVHAIPETATLDEAFEIIRSTGNSRFPLFRDHLDHILGIVYAKDLIPYLNGNGAHERPWGAEDWAAVVRPPLFVPLGRRLDDMLDEFQRTGTHIAIVVDEYGGTAGIVTLEDVLEEIVGDIRDEHDLPEDLPYQPVGPSTFRVDAGVDLDDLSEALGLDLDTEAFDFETLGGLIFHCLGRIPDTGDEAVYQHLRMRVEEIENNRIKQVLLEVLPEPVGEASPASD